MKRVFVPQLPSRWDAGLGLWIPKINLKPAECWGEVVTLFPQSVSRVHDASRLIPSAREKMSDFDEGDYLCAVGDPALIAMTACIAARMCAGKLNLLKWDRDARNYELLRLEP